MISNYIAIDLGAESGRTVVGTLENNKITLQEVHRFPNRQINIHGHLFWDVLSLFQEIKNGLAAVVKCGFSNIEGIGIDTWGVDFGLLDKHGNLIGNPFVYRDRRNDGMLERAFKIIPKEKIYSIAGTQFMQINTAYQLLGMALSESPALKSAENLLFMPDLFNYFLTGKMVTEYSIASTSNLLDANYRNWSLELLKNFGIPEKIMGQIVKPGTIVGKLLNEIAAETGIGETDIIATGCHDTASAIAAVPVSSENWAYLSSGTWSLVGIEIKNPNLSNKSLLNNFTNEGGAEDTIRFHRNVMGLWLLQRAKATWEKGKNPLTYAEILELAKKSKSLNSIVDPDDELFLNPPDMIEAINGYLKKTDQNTPQTMGEYSRVIFESLAFKYRYVIDKITECTGKDIEAIHIVGGGSQNELLNQFTSNATGKQVIAGPVEATAFGNIVIQAIAKGRIKSISHGREVVSNSVQIKKYLPENSDLWNESYIKHKDLLT